MMSETIKYRVEDQVAVITLNRPERLNAWTSELGTAYFDALERAGADVDVRVIVVTGEGRGFCAGADMDLLQGIGAGEGSESADTRDARFAIGLDKPVIAAVNGACAGLGFVHALACDIRFAAKSAKFTTAFSRRGLIAEHGSSWTLPRLVGQAVALDLLLSGRVFLGDEAYELGIVNKVFEDAELMDQTMRYAKDLAANVSPASMKVIKRQVYEHPSFSLDDAMAASNQLMRHSLKQSDFKEGVASFIEKRPPSFQPLS